MKPIIKCKNCIEIKEHHAKGMCKKCYKQKYSKLDRENNKEYYKKYHQKWYKQNKLKVCLNKKEWRKNNPEKFRQQLKRYYKKYPERKSPPQYVRYHKQKDNKCLICDTKEDLHFHHTDYKNNKGITLCKGCHNEIHNS